MQTTMKHAEKNLDRLCDMAGGGQSIIIRRDGAEDVAMLGASELSSLIETMHLIRSPGNAVRLFAALERIRSRRAEEGESAARPASSRCD